MLTYIRNVVLVTLVLGFSLLWTSPAFADDSYGSGEYGECNYNEGCEESTILTMPPPLSPPPGQEVTPLKIAVNLADGQEVPSDGYDIVITPLNGEGTSFSKVDIYIDNKLVATVEPDETGTATWHWDPEKNPGSIIKIVATNQDGTKVSKKFRVVLKEEPPQQESPQDNGPVSGGAGGKSDDPPSGNFVTRAVSGFIVGVETIIKKLPEPVVIGFPYLLFILLLIEITILVLQTKRELSELKTLQRLLAQEREVSALKLNFLQLVSHYLRTPLTILRSGAEGLARDGVAANVIASIQQTATSMHETIESIISTIDKSAADTIASTSVPVAAGQHQTRQKIAVWLPVIFVGVFAALFVYLANKVTEFDVGFIGIAIQIIIYVILVSAVYQVWRRLHLHRKDRQNNKALLEEAVAVQSSRDQVIHQTADRLQPFITSLESSIALVPATAMNSKFVNEGLSRFKTVQREFLIATKLEGAQSNAPYVPITLASIFDAASKRVGGAAQEKKIELKLANDISFTTQSPSLAAIVTQTILDNAIAYSHEGGSVEVGGNVESGTAKVLITDHGQGIPPEKVSTLLQPFSKAEGAEVFTHEGMGFSLYLDKLIMAYLGGDITIQSSLESGTQVGLTWKNA